MAIGLGPLACPEAELGLKNVWHISYYCGSLVNVASEPESCHLYYLLTSSITNSETRPLLGKTNRKHSKIRLYLSQSPKLDLEKCATDLHKLWIPLAKTVNSTYKLFIRPLQEKCILCIRPIKSVHLTYTKSAFNL